MNENLYDLGIVHLARANQCYVHEVVTTIQDDNLLDWSISTHQPGYAAYLVQLRPFKLAGPAAGARSVPEICHEIKVDPEKTGNSEELQQHGPENE